MTGDIALIPSVKFFPEAVGKENWRVFIDADAGHAYYAGPFNNIFEFQAYLYEQCEVEVVQYFSEQLAIEFKYGCPPRPIHYWDLFPWYTLGDVRIGAKSLS